jgi:hypothetical protein
VRSLVRRRIDRFEGFADGPVTDAVLKRMVDLRQCR